MMKKANKSWLESWQRAEISLKQIKQDELCNYNYEAHIPAIDGMLQWAFDNRTTRTTSGLIEQQKFFMKMKKNR